MNYKHGRFKRLFAMFLVLVMLATSGNGYSIRALAQESQDATGQSETVVPESETNAPETVGETTSPGNQGTTEQSSSDTQAPTEQSQETAQSETQLQSEEQTTGDPQSPGEDGSTGQSTAQPESQSETQAQTTQQSTGETQPPADNGIMLMDAGNEEEAREFAIEASINAVGTTSAEIPAGGSFTYIIGYTVPPTSGGETYDSVNITIDLSAYKDRLSVAAATEPGSGTGGLEIVGEDVQSAYIQPSTSQLVIRLNQSLTTGTGRTVTIRFFTDNFEWEDGSEIVLEPVLTGKTNTGTDVVGSLESGKEAKVTVTADDGWQVTKSVGKVTSDEDYYYVPYTIQLENTTTDGTVTDTDRMGRLAMKQFSLEDILPKLDQGQLTEDGKHIGYPNGGAAVNVTDVTMNGTALTQGRDYTYTAGDDTITFLHMGTASQAGAYVAAGTPVDTTYTYTVVYPRMPYMSPSNVPAAEEYWLQNTADLKYTLLGQSEKEDQDTADIILGEKAEAGQWVNLTVKKVVSIGGEEYAFSEELYGAVSFGLYSNEDCTNVAQNVNGTIAAGTPQNVGSNGTVTFQQLAAGTYYIKETPMGTGLTNSDPVVKVTVDEDGFVTVDESEATAKVENGQVVVTNTAEGYGNLEFYKYGKDSQGTTGPLEGAEFTLTSQDGDREYTAVSDSSGRVFFEGIPAGDYTLKETAVSDSEYKADSRKISVTITGNTTNYPGNLPNEDNLTAEDTGIPVYENISPKGRFQFTKVDSSETDTKLTGAQFKLYGPFDTETAQIPEDSEPVQYNGSDYILTSGADGTATSIPLDAGWYIMEEITAPEGYTIEGDGLTTVQVTANTVNTTVTISNVKLYPLTIEKMGTIQNGSGEIVNTEPLAGAVFEIYDSKEEGAEPIATIETYLDGANGSTSGIKQEDGSYKDLLLPPGTYYYKEIKAPDGYVVADNDLHELVLTKDQTSFPVNNSANFAEILITKTDSKDKTVKLSGAVFGVYYDNACKDPVMDGSTAVTITTGADGTGKARVPALDSGTMTYYLKEITAPDGYALSDAVIPVTVSKNQQTAEEIDNTQLRSIQVKKTDSKTGAALSGATFDIWGPYESKLGEDASNALTVSDLSHIISGQTTENGTYTFSGLQPGKWYYIRETAAPAGYVINPEGQWVQATVSDDDLSVEVTFKNDRLGDLVISKTTDMDADGNTNPAYAGAVFSLYKASQYNEDTEVFTGDPVKTGTTDTNGSLKFTDLDPGDYYLVETGVAKGDEDAYTLLDPIKVTVSAGMNKGTEYTNETEEIINHATKGKVAVQKISSIEDSDGNPVYIGAEFAIYKDADGDGILDDEEASEPVKTLKTTAGVSTPVLSDWLDPGDYFLVETAVDDGYVLDSTPKKFVIKERETNTSSFTDDNAIKNVPKGKVTFNKKAVFKVVNANGQIADDAKYDLKGAVLWLFPKTSDNADPSDDIKSTDQCVQIIDMRELAEVTSDYLNPGEYWVVEAESPDGYTAGLSAQEVTLDGKYYFVVGSCTVEAGKTDTSMDIDNYTNKGKIRIYKRDLRTKDLLNGAKFWVYKVVDEGTEGATQGPDGNWVVLVEASASTDGKGLILESGTHEAGSALTVDLEPGKYYIYETTTPDEFLEWAEGGTANNQWHPVDGPWFGPYTVKKQQETVADIYNYQVSVIGRKIDEYTNAGLSGAFIVAFANEKDAQDFKSYRDNLNIAINEEDKATMRANLKNSDFLTKYGIVDQAESVANGNFTFTALQPGKKYYIVEAIPPAGYDLTDAIYKWTLKDDGTGFIESNAGTIRDVKLGRLSIKKVTELSDVEYLVSDIPFKVYEAVENANGKYKNDGDGKSYSKVSETPIAFGKTTNGIYTSILLPAGTYIVEEDTGNIPEDSIVKAPEDRIPYAVIYVAAGSTTSDGSNATFTNPAKYGKFLLKKVDQEGNAIAATFRLDKLVEASPEETWETVKDSSGNDVTITTPSTGTGIYESDFLEPGKYRLVEIAADGYTIAYGEDNAVEFKIVEGQLTGSTDRDVEPGGIPRTIRNVTSVNDPILLANNEQGSISLKKVGVFDSQVLDADLQGVTFTLYQYTGNGDYTGGTPVNVTDGNWKLVEAKTTDANGQITWDKLDAGCYYFVETGIVPGSEADGKYSVDSTVGKVVKLDPGETISYTQTPQNGAAVGLAGTRDADDPTTTYYPYITNVTTYGQFTIKKVDANDHTKALSGAEFEIYTNADCTERAKDINGNDASMTTGNDGTVTSPLLPGSITGMEYYLKEVTAPTGYAVSKEITGPYIVTGNNTADYSTESQSDKWITNIKLFSIVVYKKQTKTETMTDDIPVSGAKIGLYTELSAAQAGMTTGKGVVGTDTTDATGVARFTDLKFSAMEQTYYIREITAPENYKLNTTVYSLTVAYNPNQTVFTFTATDPADDGVIYNDLLGNVTIHKQGSWQGINQDAQANINLSGVGFSLYKVNKCGEAHAQGAAAAATMSTGEDGYATSIRLEEGWYELVETGVPDQYKQADSYWVHIQNNETTTVLYEADGTPLGSNTIVNTPIKGNFVLYKYDGSDKADPTKLTQLAGAVFELEKYDETTKTWSPVNPAETTFTMSSHSDGSTYYTSGYLDPGKYRITEIEAPTYTYTDGGVSKTISFSLLDKPIDFTITAGVTISLNAYNSPKGSITLTKYGVASLADIMTGAEKLEGATFRLYRDKDCTNEVTWDIVDSNGHVIGTQESLRTTDASGVARWENLDPGTYWIKETDEGEEAVNDAGYGISSEVKEVIIESGGLIEEVKNGDLDESVSFYNEANAGKIRILKLNASGTERLAGAEFEIYAQDSTQADGWSALPVQTLTITDAAQGAVSAFLPAAKEGTRYKIVEVKAPDGYTLDNDFFPLEQEVTVYPKHDPANVWLGDDENNCFVFKNRTQSSIAGLDAQIHKQIREAGDGDDETAFTDALVTASDSLLNSSYTLEFKLDGYGAGTNEKPIEELTVTDNNITLYYLNQVNSGTSSYEPLTVKDGDYTINSVTVKASVNGDTNEKVTASVYAQYTMEQKASGTWHLVQVLEDVSTDQTLLFNQAVIGVKVVYGNTLEGFSSDGLILNVTFANRGTWSTADDPEVRQITNNAQVSWKDVYLDENGQIQRTDIYDLNSNTVTAQIPSYESKIPTAMITTEITDSKTTFYSGDEINFRITAENLSDDDDEKILRQPVISFKLPAQTTLDETSWNEGFLVTKISADGTRIVIRPELYTLTETETMAAESYLGGNNFKESDTLTTTQYAFAFKESEDTQLKPGDRLVIQFSGFISYERKTGFDLVIPGYLSSTAKIPVSAENPKGMSFVPYGQEFYDNEVADSLVEDDLSYTHDTDTRYVNDTNQIQLLKEIGTMEADGTIHWYGRGEVAGVHPSDEIYYRLTLYNYSDQYVNTAKLVDIFPCANDTYVLTSSEVRGTDIPFGEGYEDMKLLSATAGEGASVTWYSTTHNWSTRSSDEQTTILQPMYYTQSDWSQGWSQGIAQNATALGMEIDFTNGGTTQGLESYGTYEIIIAMETPGYTADKIDEYYGKFMDNSAAVSVVKAGSENLDTIPLSEMAEPNKVRATMDLPTGSIGDYVWFDRDLDGIQDDDEEPVEGMAVELWQTRYYEFNGSVRRETSRIAVTQTDQDGKYLFTDLACQYLRGDAQEGSQDPEDYVGGEYYTYQVKFIADGEYEGYTFTQRYAGEDQAVDSDADVNGESGNVTLRVISNADGSLSGERNLTIDAGITASYALGDYVWLDTNCNGVQDDTEAGVSGVPVFLYKVDGPDGQVQEDQSYISRVTTDENGYYCFDDLPEGYYVVEFDISDLRKQNDGGYTYRYDFTVVQDSDAVSGTDSDARHAVDADGRIRRTNVISLTEEALRTDGIYDHRDMRWDAGLVVYSAIGGFVFDDQDYDDLQSLLIPLEGTIVELYEVNPDGSIPDTPIATQVVGADGEYYFDHLFFGTEYKDYSVKFIYPEGYLGVEANADGDGATSEPSLDSDKDSDVNQFETDPESGAVDRTQGYIRRIRLYQDMVTDTWDAGARKYSTIGDYVWFDNNKDGIQDADEEPVAGVIVVLQSRQDKDSEWTYETWTTTDENGYYQFDQLESSSYITKEYRVVFALSEDTQITVLNAGGNSAVDSDAIGTYRPDIIPVVAPGQTHQGGYVTTYIKPGYGETDLTWDAGIIRVFGAVGDYVWYDDNYDGIQDPDEKGVPGVSVVLEMNTSGNSRDEDAWVVVGETTTDENGYYIFEGLDSGYYRVRFRIPDDYVNTRYNRGTGENGNEVDSDASRDAGDGWYYSSTFYLAQGQRDMTWDAGIYKPITRTEVTTDRRPIDRVTIDRVTQTRRIPRTIRTVRTIRGVRTGDDMNLILYLGVAAVSLGVILTILVLRRKKGDKKA